MNAPVYVDIDQGIQKVRLKVARNEKRGFSFSINISVGSNLVRFGGSFGFLRFGRFEVRFLGPN